MLGNFILSLKYESLRIFFKNIHMQLKNIQKNPRTARRRLEGQIQRFKKCISHFIKNYNESTIVPLKLFFVSYKKSQISFLDIVCMTETCAKNMRTQFALRRGMYLILKLGCHVLIPPKIRRDSSRGFIFHFVMS